MDRGCYMVVDSLEMTGILTKGQGKLIHMSGKCHGHDVHEPVTISCPPMPRQQRSKRSRYQRLGVLYLRAK